MDSTSTLRSVPLSHSFNCENADVSDLEPTSASELTDASKQQIARMYSAISDEMEQIEQRFQLELQTPYESLVPILRHGTQLGGKRLRPAMLLLSAAACGKLSADHVALGTVIEMVHTATLIHDDVLDAADTRRHVPTVNAMWNNHTSILLGDYLFAQAFRLAATLGSIEVCQWLGEASRLICEGEMRQVLTRDVIDLDEPTYLEMIQGKTAELCRVGCRLGARFAGGSPAAIEALSSYGNSLGIAFQIADDYLDLWGSDQRAGKTLGTDLEQGKMTLPLIRLLCTASEGDRKQIRRLLSGPSHDRAERLAPWIDQSDAKLYTQQVADNYRQSAIDSLELLDQSEAKESLIAIANFAVHRRF
ncbi:polyprenyl synthetase family protein [Novipirellula artificiosorum]|uniref:Octaprenyl-diphosphate synthase n=1 Tax=Novipirellula artificiosorum TaxID=2528016 RepID=A0A5C6E1P5_9BACT|nr:polyprenyl synthetase family protein [Novipirellula artificiosorum]TWU42404.1 Octaprenyl-diphosphate synthase [Novipirellula artificiosorum]